MLAALRQVYGTHHQAIMIPVTVVLGLTLQQILLSTVSGFEIAAARHGNDFTISVFGVNFMYQSVLPYVIALPVLFAIAYVLFFMPLSSGSDDESGMRECPQCKSEIVAEATRCAFCTSALTPPSTSAADPAGAS